MGMEGFFCGCVIVFFALLHVLFSVLLCSLAFVDFIVVLGGWVA